VANGNPLEEGTRTMPFASQALDEKASKRMLFLETNVPAFDAA